MNTKYKQLLYISVIILILLLIRNIIINKTTYNNETFNNIINNNITIVSAYYPMQSKHDLEKYKKWINNLYGNVGFNLVFFTNKEYTPYINNIRKNYKNTKVITLEFEELACFKKYGIDFWKKQETIDPENNIHNYKLYCIWYEKKEFVKKAIEINPFNSDYFIWIDGGICRDEKWIPYLKKLPNPKNISYDKMMILSINDKFLDLDDYTKVDTVGGGIIGGPSTLWLKYDKLYDNEINNYLNNNKFIGKDQPLIASIIKKNKELFNIIKGRKYKDNTIEYNEWFTLLFYLSK